MQTGLLLLVNQTEEIFCRLFVKTYYFRIGPERDIANLQVQFCLINISRQKVWKSVANCNARSLLFRCNKFCFIFGQNLMGGGTNFVPLFPQFHLPKALEILLSSALHLPQNFICMHFFAINSDT